MIPIGTARIDARDGTIYRVEFIDDTLPGHYGVRASQVRAINTGYLHEISGMRLPGETHPDEVRARLNAALPGAPWHVNIMTEPDFEAVGEVYVDE